MKLIDLVDVSTAYVKALIYGPPGTGKTNFGVSGPKPLLLLSEKQAVINARDAARRMKRPMPLCLVMESLDDYRHVLRALNGDKAKPFVVMDDAGNVVLQSTEWPETVVLDSITDVADTVSKEIREQSPQKLGKDGLPVDSERYWNVLSDRTAKLIRAFRDLPMHVVFLALLTDKEIGEEGDKQRVIVPKMPMRALPDVLAAAVNVVGVTYRKRATVADPVTKARPMTYGIATTGPDCMMLKPYPPLRDTEVTDFTSWVARINGIDDGSVAPPAPDLTAGSLEAGDVTAGAADKPATETTPPPPATPTEAQQAAPGATDTPVADVQAATAPTAATGTPATPAGKAGKKTAATPAA